MKSTFHKFVIGCDHTAIKEKEEIIDFLREQDIVIEDVGNSDDPKGIYFCDIAERAAIIVAEDTTHTTGGILLCGNGVGMAIAANKVPGVRASVCNELYTVKYAKRDIHLNVLCMGVRIIPVHLMKEIITTWAEQETGDGRFAFRVKRLEQVEQHYVSMSNRNQAGGL